MDTASQVAEVLDGLQASFRLGSEGGERRCQEVAECLPVASSHTTTHLVQVTQAEVLCGIDDDGVGVRYVDTALDDGRGQ